MSTKSTKIYMFSNGGFLPPIHVKRVSKIVLILNLKYE